MDERRRHKRITVEGVHGNLFFTSKVEIINMSLGGVAIKLTKSLMLGKEYTIRLENKTKSIDIKGTVVWSVLSGSQKGPHGDVVPVYYAGLKFDEVLTSKTTDLIDFIESHKSTGTEERLRGLRFKIHAPSTTLSYPSSYRVKLISPYGMLIETLHALKPEDSFPMEILLKDGRSVRFLGRIVSCTEVKDKIPICYDIGVEFLQVNAEDRPNLEVFIHSISADEKDRNR